MHDVQQNNRERKGVPALSPVLITLFKGVLYQDQSPELWRSLLELQGPVRDHAGVFGLELMLDEAEGFAYLRQRVADDEPELPKLVQRRQLGYAVSLLLALLRKKLAEHDAVRPQAQRRGRRRPCQTAQGQRRDRAVPEQRPEPHLRRRQRPRR